MACEKWCSQTNKQTKKQTNLQSKETNTSQASVPTTQRDEMINVRFIYERYKLHKYHHMNHKTNRKPTIEGPRMEEKHASEQLLKMSPNRAQNEATTQVRKW